MNGHSTDEAQNQHALNQDQIEAMLTKLGFSFEVHGRIKSNLHYKSLRAASPRGIYYLSGGARLPESATDSLILIDEMPPASTTGVAYITLKDPQLAFYKLMRASHPDRFRPGIHKTAIVDPDAVISSDTYIGPYCIIEAEVQIAGGCFLDSQIVVKSGSMISSGARIEPHCTIGATGVAWVWDECGRKRVIQPQLGGVYIGSNVFLGSDISIVRGSVNEITDIGDETVIAHGTKIGHGCRIGRQAHLANNVSLAGNVDAGYRTFFGSGAVVRPHIRIADRVVVGAGAVVIENVFDTGVVIGGVPAKIISRNRKRLTGVPTDPAE